MTRRLLTTWLALASGLLLLLLSTGLGAPAGADPRPDETTTATASEADRTDTDTAAEDEGDAGDDEPEPGDGDEGDGPGDPDDGDEGAGPGDGDEGEDSGDPGDGDEGEDPDEGDEGEDDATAFTVDDAVFRWGINNESNNAAFAPGTFNFPSAGKAPNPGAGGQVINANGNWPSTGKKAWRASQGKVRIEKVNSKGNANLATLAGLKTGPDGEKLGGPSTAIFSSHQVVVSGGTGEVDAEAGTARIAWKGSFTVFYYSGMVFFSLTDPVLTVAPGSAKITATASGYGSSIDDQTKWEKLPDKRVTIADLTGVGAKDLTKPKGFTAATAYRGVRYTPGDGSSQVRTGADWGSFPTSFVRYLEAGGSGAYWFSSGGSSDRFKVAMPVSISWDAKHAIEPEAPPASPPQSEQPQPVNNPGAVPPAIRPPGPALPDLGQPTGPVLPSQLFGSNTTLPVGSTMPTGYEPPVSYALASASTSSDRAGGSNHAWEWVLGILLLLGAVGITVFNPLMHRLKGTR